MAGCGECPDQCSCVVVNQCAEQYPGAGTADAPIIIPERYDYPWVGESSDGTISITPADVRDPGDCSEPDGHNPDLTVNFCNVIDGDNAEDGDVLVVRDEDADCRPHRLRDPLEGEVLARDPVTGRASWQGGVASFGGDMPYGVPLEFWGSEAAVPLGYGLCDFGLIPIADNPNLFATIGFNASGGVDPGGGMFHKPDKRGYVAAGRDNMGGTPANRVTHANADVLGGTLGAETLTIAIGEVPVHSHGVNDPGHSHGFAGGTHSHSITDPGHGHATIAAGDHFHYPGSGSIRGFITYEGATSNAAISVAGDDDVIIVLSAGDLSQKNNAATLNEGTHTHTITGSGTGITVNDASVGGTVNGAGTGISIQNAGGGGAIPAPRKLQPTQFVNYIIRLG